MQTPWPTFLASKGPDVRPIQVPFDTLVSFHYFGGVHESIVAELHAAGCLIIGDSGAYSAMSLGKPIDLDKFCEWAERNRRYLAWIASLDAIGAPEQSLANYKYMTRHGLDVVPTVHFPAPPATLDRYADQELVGLGGVAARKDHKTVLKWLVSMFRYARTAHPAMRFHGWGLTRSSYLDHLPFYSVDSSGFGAGYRYGQVTVFDPDTRKRVTFGLDRRAAAAHWQILRRHYGTAAVEFSTSTAVNRALHVHLAMLSAQHMSRYYQKRHRVAPPRGLHLPGTRIHYVDASVGNLRLIAAATQRKDPA